MANLPLTFGIGRSRTLPGQAHSTQVYRWPGWLDHLTVAAPVMGATALVTGLLLVRHGTAQSNLGELSVGLLLCVFAAGMLVLLLVAHLTLAREARFTRDRLILHQTGREPIVLAYSYYQRSWVVDLSNPESVRFILFQGNRGCIVLSPPDWILAALLEVIRIQQEEGWYDPESWPAGEVHGDCERSSPSCSSWNVNAPER